nr:MAG TPA: hypothetical protein [Caudoviricetes sp.]
MKFSRTSLADNRHFVSVPVNAISVKVAFISIY